MTAPAGHVVTCSHCHGSGCDPAHCQNLLCANPDHPPCPECDAVGAEWVPDE